MNGTYRFADTDVRIEHLYPAFARMAADYAVAAPAGPETELLGIAVTEEDVDAERAHAEEQDRRDGIPPRDHSDGYLETLAIYRKLCERLIERDIVLIHGSAVEMDGTACLFTAPSGTGKSTHARLWQEVFGERLRFINDDKPLLRFEKDRVLVCGTPWDGKHRRSENVSAPLGAVFVLSRGKTNRVQRLSAVEVLPFLLRQMHRPAAAEGAARQTELALRLAAEVPAFSLACNMQPEAALVAYRALKGETL